MSNYQLLETVKCQATFSKVPATVSGIVITDGGAERTLTPTVGDSPKTYYAYYIPSGEGGHRYTFTGYTPDVIYKETGTFNVVDFSATDVDYLIGDLRLYLGDLDTDDYQFSRETLSDALLLAIKTLGRRWRRKYRIVNGVVKRNKSEHRYQENSPPIIQYNDEPPIIVQAAIIVKSSELKDHIWDLQSWADDEVRFSNLGAGRGARDDLQRDEKLLDELLEGKLLGTRRQALPGFGLPRNIREGYR